MMPIHPAPAMPAEPKQPQILNWPAVVRIDKKVEFRGCAAAGFAGTGQRRLKKT